MADIVGECACGSVDLVLGNIFGREGMRVFIVVGPWKGVTKGYIM